MKGFVPATLDNRRDPKQLPGLAILESYFEDSRVLLICERLDLGIEDRHSGTGKRRDKMLTIFDLRIAVSAENHLRRDSSSEPTIIMVNLTSVRYMRRVEKPADADYPPH